MAKAGKNVKNNVLPHSKAKLDLYKNYLEHYLRVLCLANFCTRINIYDIFCGTGRYEDGNIGSPLIAKDCIKAAHSLLKTLQRPIKPITLTVNDYEEEKIKNVRVLLEQEKLPLCLYDYFSKDADEMLNVVSRKINSFPSSDRNLVFIDPYGYSKIHKEKIYQILKNECSEVILFLPVMQMYRFTDTALSQTEKKCYEHLRQFIYSFFPPEHKIRTDGINDIFEYINEIKTALSFKGQFYTSSHYIERDKGNYYAVFFITANIYGLEKMLEVKWKMDPVKGKGFDQKKQPAQTVMFQEEFEEHDKRRELDYLTQVMLDELKMHEFLTNNDIYKLSLKNEFRPTHANTVLKQLSEKKIRITYHDGIEAKSLKHFGINYENFRNGTVKTLFFLNN